MPSNSPTDASDILADVVQVGEADVAGDVAGDADSAIREAAADVATHSDAYVGASDSAAGP
jgi:hypothetical protein